MPPPSGGDKRPPTDGCGPGAFVSMINKDFRLRLFGYLYSKGLAAPGLTGREQADTMWEGVST